MVVGTPPVTLHGSSLGKFYHEQPGRRLSRHPSVERERLEGTLTEPMSLDGTGSSLGRRLSEVGY